MWLMTRNSNGDEMKTQFNNTFIDEIIRMAWADDISFNKIKKDNGLSEAEVIKIMSHSLKPGSFELWRKWVFGRRYRYWCQIIAILWNSRTQAKM